MTLFLLCLLLWVSSSNKKVSIENCERVRENPLRKHQWNSGMDRSVRTLRSAIGTQERPITLDSDSESEESMEGHDLLVKERPEFKQERKLDRSHQERSRNTSNGPAKAIKSVRDGKTHHVAKSRDPHSDSKHKKNTLSKTTGVVQNREVVGPPSVSITGAVTENEVVAKKSTEKPTLAAIPSKVTTSAAAPAINSDHVPSQKLSNVSKEKTTPTSTQSLTTVNRDKHETEEENILKNANIDPALMTVQKSLLHDVACEETHLSKSSARHETTPPLTDVEPAIKLSASSPRKQAQKHVKFKVSEDTALEPKQGVSSHDLTHSKLKADISKAKSSAKGSKSASTQKRVYNPYQRVSAFSIINNRKPKNSNGLEPSIAAETAVPVIITAPQPTTSKKTTTVKQPTMPPPINLKSRVIGSTHDSSTDTAKSTKFDASCIPCLTGKRDSACDRLPNCNQCQKRGSQCQYSKLAKVLRVEPKTTARNLSSIVKVLKPTNKTKEKYLSTETNIKSKCSSTLTSNKSKGHRDSHMTIDEIFKNKRKKAQTKESKRTEIESPTEKAKQLKETAALVARKEAKKEQAKNEKQSIPHAVPQAMSQESPSRKRKRLPKQDLPKKGIQVEMKSDSGSEGDYESELSSGSDTETRTYANHEPKKKNVRKDANLVMNPRGVEAPMSKLVQDLGCEVDVLNMERPRRGTRKATRQDYKIYEDEGNNVYDDNGGDVILSEEEQDRRLLNGQVDFEFISHVQMPVVGPSSMRNISDDDFSD